MKVIFFPIAIFPFLYGCTLAPPTTLQQQKSFDDEEHKTRYGEVWTVNKLKENYKKKTGMTLTSPDTTSCGWDGTCYYNAWSAAHDNGISTFNANKLEEKKIAESKCLADQECKNKKELSAEMRSLSSNYTTFVYTNPYQQADYDYFAREICGQAEYAQKNGVSRDTLVNKFKDLPGIAPRERLFIARIADGCWKISSLGGNWKEALRY